MQLLQRCEKLFNTTEGRDKIFKSVQYTGRFALYHLACHPGSNPQLISLLTKLVSTLSSARRVFRLGRWIGDINGFVSSLHSRENTKLLEFAVSFVTNILGLASDTCEDLNWLGNQGIIPQHIGEKASFISDATWAAGLVFDIYFALGDLIFDTAKLSRQISAVKRNELIALFWQFVSTVKLFCDMVVAMTYAFELKTNKGTMVIAIFLVNTQYLIYVGVFAICGLVSALVSLRKLWKKTA